MSSRRFTILAAMTLSLAALAATAQTPAQQPQPTGVEVAVPGTDAADAAPVVPPTRLETFKASLSAPVQIDSLTTVMNTVYVDERGDAAEVVKAGAEALRRTTAGYRVVIFMSNSQSARGDAIAANDSFALLYPGERSYITYENPYFKVSVGNCTSQEEAIILMERVRGNFPKAFLMRETIPASELESAHR